jgi:selenocysteine-specific elongation factor
VTEKHFIVATAGHVDHGKSALVKALTGTDPDRLPEEKARGITIDLGFAHLSLDDPNGERLHIGIVDVPGHEDFVRNMIAGVGSIDLALLVVAADDGWMPQTEEHLQILEYLGITRAVIALTKIDIGDADKTETKIREQLCGTPFDNARLVRTSLRPANLIGLTEQVCTGIAALKRALAVELAQIEPQRDIAKPRLFVDRAFTLRGIGTVVTGTLTSGTLHVGDAVVVQPRGTRSRIRSLQRHGHHVDLAEPGTRTAINLPDLAPGSGIARGDAVTIDDLEPTRAIGVRLRRSPRSQQAPPIKSGSSVYFHHGTSRILAKIILLELDALAPGAEGIARLELSRPALVFIGDRFSLRDGSEQRTIAGGLVLDLDVEREDFHSATHVALMKGRCAAKDDDVDLYTKTELSRHDAVAPPLLLQRSRFTAADVAAALQRLAERGEIFLHDDTTADLNAWRMLRQCAVQLIDKTHREHPERAGLEVSELRSALIDQSQETVDALIVDLCGREFVRVGSIIARASHRPKLPRELEQIAGALRERLAASAFDPPSRKQLAPDAKTQQVLRFSIAQKEIIEIADDLVLSRTVFEQSKTAIADFLRRHGPATVSQLRQALGSSRRVMVPLLERLDREGFTRRAGDKRTLAPPPVDAKLSDASVARPN